MIEQDVLGAQDQWAAAIVKIGMAYTAGTDVAAVARNEIDTLYDYSRGKVLFKPTKCEQRQFRLTADGALSYFVGHELSKSHVQQPDFPEDKGFAIAPYVSVQFMNAGIICYRKRAIAMGNYIFTKPDGSSVKVEYTFGYRLRKSGIKINLHHSSIPFSN